MEPRGFDALARGVARRASRRTALRSVVGTVLGSFLALGVGRPVSTVRGQQGPDTPEERAAVIASVKERLLIASGIVEPPVEVITCRAPLEVCRQDDVCCTGSCTRGRCQCLENGSACANDDQCCTRRCDLPLLALVGTCKNR